MTPQRNHRLDGKRHPGLRHTDSFVLRVVRYIRRGVEDLVDAVAAVCFDHGSVLRLGVLFDHVARLAEGHAWFNDFDGFGQTSPCGFDDADCVRVGEGGGAHVVGFV